ncbi:MAG: two-component regulator propeller domain-containing protein [Saprospiraceae bacterium]
MSELKRVPYINYIAFNRKLLPILFVILINSFLSAQNYTFQHVTVADGLPENSVMAMIQDHLGFLWLGTQEGLVKYDGQNMTIFKYEQADSVKNWNNSILTLKEDRQGNLWVGTLEGLNFFDRESQTFSRYNHIPEDDTLTFDNKKIILIEEDQAGNIWVVSNRGRKGGDLHRWDKKSQSFKHYFMDTDESKANPALHFIWSRNETYSNAPNTWVTPPFYEDRKGVLWVGTYGDGLKKYDSERDTFVSYGAESHNHKKITNDSIISIFEDKQENLWIGTRNGIHQLNKDRNHVATFFHDATEKNSLSSNLARVVWQDNKDNLWINTARGLDQLNPKTGEFIHFSPDPNDKHSISYPTTFPIHEDKKGNLWFLSLSFNEFASQTLHRYDYSSNSFIRFRGKTPGHPTGFVKGVSSMSYLTDRTGILYIGSWRGGLNVLNLPAKKFDDYKLNASLKLQRFTPNQNTINTAAKKSLKATKELWLAEDDNKLLWIKFSENDEAQCLRIVLKDSQGFWWIGYNSNDGGLFRVDFSKQQFTQFFIDPSDPTSLFNNSVFQIIEDSNNQVWIAEGWDGGLYQYLSDEGGFRRYKRDYNDSLFIENASIYSIVEGAQGFFWLGTDGTGPYKFDPKTKALSLVNKRFSTIWTVYEDSQERLWAGTLKSGLVQFDKSNGDVIQQYTLEEGLSSNSVFDILEDAQGNLWLYTEHGLACFNPTTKQIRNYFTQDGLLTNNSNGLRFLQKASSGEIFINSTPDRKELNRFFPEQINDNPFPPQLVFTDFQIMNNKDPKKEGRPTLKQNINLAKEIALSHHQNDFIFKFQALHYCNPEENTYAYKLEPYETEWRYMGTNNTASYTNIDPGNYSFQVKAANCDGVWNEEGITMQLTITPPWWKTNLAYAFFLISFFGLLYSLYRFQLNRQLQLEETNRLRELDNFKSKLYTNITHEFRTPLTVILGMADQVKKQPEKAITLIKRNGQNLLTLVNQMLDLSKLESGNLKLELEQKDVVSFLLYVAESFQSLAESKGIRLMAYSEIDELIMDYDEEKLKQVVSNLLTNAIKFTNENGKVILHITAVASSPKKLQIKVQDNGIGIPPDQLPKIFDRFYQVNDSSIRKGEGTGIGLALTKELVKLMNGEISVTSQLKKGTEFKIILPIQNLAPKAKPNLTPIKKAPAKMEAATSMRSSKVEINSSSGKPILLLIEDNEDVITYIQTCLEEDYEIKKAINGQLGIDKAFELIPDLIISDVMMPEKDGYEVCAILKTDTRTSHIPIILLTAKTTEEDKIAGLKQGADAYLTKPFNKEELLVRLEKLLALRIQLQERYSTFVPDQNKTAVAATPESAFLNKIHQLVEENISDDGFGIPQLCREMGMSRSQIYRKLISLTGKSTSIYLRSIRLHKAKVLLQNPQLTISEVAYNVGYSDPAYFSRLFTKEFGVPPSDYRAK